MLCSCNASLLVRLNLAFLQGGDVSFPLTYSEIRGSYCFSYIPALMQVFWHCGAKVQVTGHRSGYRSQATGQVTGQTTGHKSGHRLDHRSHTKTIGHWTTLSWLTFYHTKIKQAKEPQLYFFCSELYQIPHMRKYIHVDHARRTSVTA